MTQSSTDNSLVERLREALGGIAIPAMMTDNLAISLATYFDDGSEPNEHPAWSDAAINGANATLDAIHAHYASAISTLERELEEARALVKKEQEAWMDIERANRELFDGAVDDILKIKAAEARATAAEAKVARMGEALKPFAKAGELVGTDATYDFWAYRPAAGDEYGISGNDLARARSALQSEKDREGGE